MALTPEVLLVSVGPAPAQARKTAGWSEFRKERVRNGRHVVRTAHSQWGDRDLFKDASVCPQE